MKKVATYVNIDTYIYIYRCFCFYDVGTASEYLKGSAGGMHLSARDRNLHIDDFKGIRVRIEGPKSHYYVVESSENIFSLSLSQSHDPSWLHFRSRRSRQVSRLRVLKTARVARLHTFAT